MGTVQNVKDNNQINASKQESISSNPVAFKNSKTLPESLHRLEDIPLNVIKSLVSSYLLVITSINFWFTLREFNAFFSNCDRL